MLKKIKDKNKTKSGFGKLNCAYEKGMAAKDAASFSNKAVSTENTYPKGKRSILGKNANIPINTARYIIGVKITAGIFARGVKRYTPPKAYKMGIKTNPDVTVAVIIVSLKYCINFDELKLLSAVKYKLLQTPSIARKDSCVPISKTAYGFERMIIKSATERETKRSYFFDITSPSKSTEHIRDALITEPEKPVMKQRKIKRSTARIKRKNRFTLKSFNIKIRIPVTIET